LLDDRRIRIRIQEAQKHTDSGLNQYFSGSGCIVFCSELFMCRVFKHHLENNLLFILIDKNNFRIRTGGQRPILPQHDLNRKYLREETLKNAIDVI